MPKSLFDDFLQPYDGPVELRMYTDFLAPIGEIVITFSRLERRVTWALESLLKITKEEADALEGSIMNFSTRINVFRTVAKPYATSDKLMKEYQSIIKRIDSANSFRNEIIHGPWVGITVALTREDDIARFTKSAKKTRFPRGPKKATRYREHNPLEIRQQAIANQQLCYDIEDWIIIICPHADKRFARPSPSPDILP
jgi:hypothetical protein